MRPGGGREHAADAASPPSPGRAFAGRTFDAVLFDMDGTLIDSAASAQRCWQQWAREFELPDPDAFQVQHGVPAAQVVPELVPPEQVAAGIARILELEIADVEGITVLPGAHRALAALPQSRQAIVTSCTRAQARARIGGSGLRAPDLVITADDVDRGKPHPDPFRRGAQALGFHPDRCLVVEDAPAGVTAARAAGCAVLGVGDPGAHLADVDAGASGLDQVLFVVGPRGITVIDAAPA